MNRKRTAVDPLLPLRSSKQPRTTLIRPDGTRASPTGTEGLASRWKSAVKVVWDLGKETVASLVPVNEPKPSIRRTPSCSLVLRTDSPRYHHARQRRGSSQTSSSSNQLPSFAFSPPPSDTEPIFKPVVTPLVASRRRPRTRRAMNPPPTPPPKISTERFPTLPPSPAPSSTDSFREGIRRNYRTREHIFAHKHKQNVLEEQKKARDELIRELYHYKKKAGYQSDLATFQGLLSYREMLEQDKKQRLGRRTPSSSLVDLHALSLEPERRVRRHSTPEISTAFLQSALEKAKATLLEPKPPKPFAPSLDQLRLRELSKDSAIEQRLRPKRAPLPKVLPPKDEAAVDVFLRKNGVISSYARESVSDKDIRRLKPGVWLNDEVINFYVAMLLGRAEGSGKENAQKKPLNAYVFTTFFWSKLEKDGYEKGRLAKWTKKIDLFAKDIALIPVNHGNAHWTGAAINFRKKRIESYDSMNAYHPNVFPRLRAYLDAEHRNKKKQPFDFTGWEDYTLEDTPQQENGYDCGVFTCQFLESLSRGEEDFNFTQQDIPYLRRRMIWEIGNAKFWTGE